MKRVLGSLLTAALAFTLTPATTSPAQAAGDGTITGIALGPDGEPLPHVGWELYLKDGSEWTTLQFGPKTTSTSGRFTYPSQVGTEYRVCFYDTYYGHAGNTPTGYWQPEVRHRDTCWPKSTSMETASSWTATQANPSKTFKVTLPVQGLGMAPVDPFMTGTFAVGDPITIVGQEGWQPQGATFSYQWYRHSNGTMPIAISGATGKSYTPTSADFKKWVFGEVTAKLPGYKPVTLRTPTTMVGTTHVQPTSPLTVTGSATPGGTLTATFGKPANTYHEINWYVDGVPQPDHTAYGDTPATFPVTSTHSGAVIEARLKMYATDPATGNYVDGSDSFHRRQVQISGTRPPAPLATREEPTGTPTVGKVLKAPEATADPDATVSYQWIRGKKKIAKATESRYKLRSVDLGKKIKVRMEVERPGWRRTFVGTSKATVAKRALKKGTVSIKGKAHVGKKVTARATKWGPKPVKIRYQWLRGKKAIKGATKATYKVTKKDRRAKIKVRITVKKAGYLTVTKTSKAKKVKR